jgi:hypothetical protein
MRIKASENRFISSEMRKFLFKKNHEQTLLKSLILAQNERWRRGLGMQVARESRKVSTVA